MILLLTLLLLLTILNIILLPLFCTGAIHHTRKTHLAMRYPGIQAIIMSSTSSRMEKADNTIQYLSQAMSSSFSSVRMAFRER